MNRILTCSILLLGVYQTMLAQVWVSQPKRADMWHENPSLSFQSGQSTGIIINFQTTFQSIDGFGYTLTGGSADVILALAPAERTSLLNELFGTQAGQMGISVLRLGVGATDLDGEAYSYDDIAGDVSLRKFNLAKALEWNLANNSNFGPITPGGCTECKGALTISKEGEISRNQAYYIIGQASRIIPTGSVRIDLQGLPKGLNGTTAKRPDGKIALILQNETSKIITTNLNLTGKYAEVEIPEEGGEHKIRVESRE